MAHIVFGLILFALGTWGLLRNWHGFIDLLWVAVPLLLAMGGIIAVVSGVSNFSQGRSTRHEEIGT